ncbi:hypothetical protein [Kocuria rosea]|uniref:hypothetical protein n=1 Tax=Kocuria rosea TaxID=1275 RepID=UPI000370ECEA|nr:hypothetical protein [Kocuria rosea]TQN36160.1 hypothetical protein FHX38_2018 [Kocuria rosea]STX01767.1 Uncharacterised protein [Kocuria rosea]STX05313.1 Uncharacterised protein [Kocuria rosea]VEH42877.1 Uncharacterised protein [Kocuria rosea]VEI50027.1 Uncharacterised protein [Kocuria rosea]
MGLNSIIRSFTGRAGGTAGRPAGGRRGTRGMNAAGQAGAGRSGRGLGGMLRGLLNRR